MNGLLRKRRDKKCNLRKHVVWRRILMNEYRYPIYTISHSGPLTIVYILTLNRSLMEWMPTTNMILLQRQIRRNPPQEGLHKYLPRISILWSFINLCPSSFSITPLAVSTDLENNLKMVYWIFTEFFLMNFSCIHPSSTVVFGVLKVEIFKIKQ